MKTQILLFCFTLLVGSVWAQQAPDPLTKEEKKEVVDSIGSILNNEYVFPEVGAKIQAFLQKKSAEGGYDHFTDPFAFAEELTADVRTVNNDLHMRVGFDPNMIGEIRRTVTPEDSLAFLARRRRSSQVGNYGFQEIKILEGNIGYLKLNGFFEVTEEAGRTAEAAMNLLSNADALIIDLRENGGGSPAMIQLISSYLFGDEPVHLNSFYYRPADLTTQTWTLPYVPGKRRPDRDVYVLTSSSTFSAAEEFSYNLRNLKRATLIGEVTGGGAHPGGTRIATDRFTVWVPSGRAINPITQTNWEGTGVQPHIEVPAETALLTAQTKATEKLLNSSNPENRFTYEWALAGLKAQQASIYVSPKLLQSYAGTYGPRILSYENGKLYYQREGRTKYQLIPMTEDTFRIEELSYFRIKIEMENGKPIALTGMYNNGRTDRSQRDVKP